MRFIYFLIVLFIFNNISYSQNFEGYVSVYEKGVLDMETFKDWKDVGKLDFKKKGFIQFVKNGIDLTILDLISFKTINRSLKFVSDEKSTNLITEIYPIVPVFHLQDKNKNSIDVKYFSGEIINKDTMGLFIFPFKTENKMYIVLLKENVLTKIINLNAK